MPEVKVDLDRDGRVAGAHVVANTESHQIIEEFMLSANEAVAERLSAAGAGVPRRIHAPPDPRKLRQLTEFVSELGFEVDTLESRFELQRLLGLTRGRPEEHAVHFAVLRSLARAVYGPQPEGHYALASDCYCHFTSPIRRYPDLLCHRAEDSRLAALEATEWQPLLDWAALALDAPLRVTTGIIAVTQPPDAMAALRRALAAEDALGLAALGLLVPALGSLILALAVLRGRLAGVEAYRLSVLNETFQEAFWGTDPEAERRRALVKADVLLAERLLGLANTFGCAGKQSGAGGGDGAVIFAPDESAQRAVLEAYAARKIVAFAIKPDRGLQGEVVTHPTLRGWLEPD
jgi:hypothetical protein